MSKSSFNFTEAIKTLIEKEEIDFVINFVRESQHHEGADKIYIQNLSSDGLPINFSYFYFII